MIQYKTRYKDPYLQPEECKGINKKQTNFLTKNHSFTQPLLSGISYIELVILYIEYCNLMNYGELVLFQGMHMEFRHKIMSLCSQEKKYQQSCIQGIRYKT